MVHVIELPKLAGLPEANRRKEPDLVDWSRFLAAETDDEAKEVCMNNPDIAKANKALERLSASPSAQELARRRKLALVTYQLEMTAAKEEGRAEGRAEGEAEAIRSSLLAVIDARGLTVSEEARSRIRSATTADLERWIAGAVHAASVEDLLAK